MDLLIPLILFICLVVWMYCPVISVRNTGNNTRSILFNEYKDKAKSLQNIEVWRNKLRDDYKQGLHKLPENIKKAIIAKADERMKEKWEPLLVSDFLEYKNNGNRKHYETKNFNRRYRLEAVVNAEILTGDHKYLSESANGLWLILEESTWNWPAHIAGLPDPNPSYVELGTGETSAYVAWLGFLLGDKLKRISPMLAKRIDYELNHRIIEPYLQGDFYWMGLEGQKVNNWNIWINTNVLMTTLLTVNNKTLSNQMIAKILKSADNWINWYGNDGGCDEGVSYWYEAGGRFIKILYYLSSASDHQMDWSKNKLIDNIGSYIYKMHIDKDYFVNFGDGSAKPHPDPTLVYTYGEMFKNPKMIEFSAFLFQMSDIKAFFVRDHDSGSLHLYYMHILAYLGLKNITPRAPQPLESWLPDLQVLTLRTEEGSAKGLFLGAKAGTNGESHNHNDVGNFVIYVNGMPAIIDVGVGTYNGKTFSSHRYDIWTMQSQWHNTPTINGYQQRDGGYKAKNVRYSKIANCDVFEADISTSYPKEAHVDRWVRKLTFNRTSNSIDLSETYKLSQFVEPFKLHFITVLNVAYDESKGQVVLMNKNIKLKMSYKSDILEVIVDDHKTEDPKLSPIWGERVLRVTFVAKNNDLIGNHLINFHL